MIEIFPSIISSDLLNLHQTFKDFDSFCDGYHIDVMDNHFVPNLTWGPAFVNSFIKATHLPLHVHLMVDNPQSFLNNISFRNIDVFCFHYESLKNEVEILNLIKNIKEKGARVSIAIKPTTKPEVLIPFLDIVDQILIMSVEPGFSGQEFLDVSYKIKFILDCRLKNKLSFKIAIDGGINGSNICKLHNEGIDQFAVASAIFHTKNPLEAIKTLYKCS